MRCPNCGQVFEGETCPNCGRPARSRGGRIAAVIIAVFLVMPCAVFGACSVAVAAQSYQGEGLDWAILIGLLGLVALGGAFGLGYLVRRLWRG